jgi:hypothetical protein
MSIKDKTMKMKTAISMLAAGVCALSVHQAQATLIDQDTVTLTASVGGAHFSLTTTVTQATPTSEYLYDYSFNSGSILIGAFSVNGVGQNGFYVTGVNTILSANAGFTYNSTYLTDGFVTWSGPTTTGSEDFSFLSPYAPIVGNAFAQDGHQYLTAPAGSGNSYVPNPPSVPDGGLTIALMGGSLLALAGLRRKLGC